MAFMRRLFQVLKLNEKDSANPKYWTNGTLIRSAVTSQWYFYLLALVSFTDALYGPLLPVFASVLHEVDESLVIWVISVKLVSFLMLLLTSQTFS